MESIVALDGLLNSLSQCLDAESARRLLALEISGEIRERIDSLSREANEGSLTDSDRNEYEALVNAADLIATLKLKARRQLQLSAIR